MKRFVWLGWVCLGMLCLVWAQSANAQEGGTFTVGGYADYLRAPVTGTNMFGLGGRAGVQVWDNTTLEGEMAYDFSQSFVNSFTQGTGSGVSFVNSNVRTLQFFVGPKYTLTHRGPIHPFVEAKVGFVNYMFGSLDYGFTSYENALAGLRSRSINAALLAGGGLEGKVGPVGLRFGVDDEVYFNTGAHNGLKVTFGPYFRF
jgi:hypothetical protein